MSAAIEVKDLSKWYGEVVGLNGVSFSIGTGVTGLLGPNGAGKTTLFRLLTGAAFPSLGSVRILGEPVTDNPDIFRKLGFCPEHDAFYEEMTGRQFLVMLGRVHGLSAAQAKTAAETAIERVAMQELASKKINAMSKGMRQRVKLAQALLHDPQVLLLDEPLNGMDPVLRHKTIEEIHALGASGKTVLVSSHILQEVEAMTSNILLVVHGKVLAQGTLREIRNLLDKHPRKIVVRAANPRAVGAELLNTEGVNGARIEGERGLLLETKSPEPALARLTQKAAAGEIEVDEVFGSDEDLASLFEMLVG